MPVTLDDTLEVETVDRLDTSRRIRAEFDTLLRYKEAADQPQVGSRASLRRLVNGSGRIRREYVLGNGRVDFGVVWLGPKGRESQVLVDHRLLTDGRSFAPTTDQRSKRTAQSEGRGPSALRHFFGGTYGDVEAKSVREAILRDGFHNSI